jgi:hypothetical protein
MIHRTAKKLDSARLNELYSFSSLSLTSQHDDRNVMALAIDVLTLLIIPVAARRFAATRLFLFASAGKPH